MGVGRDADLAVFSISVPDLLTAMLVGGAFGAVLIPEIHRVTEREGRDAGHQLVLQWLTVVAGVSSLLVVALSLLAPAVVRLLAPGFSDESFPQAVGLLQIVVLAFPLCTTAAVFSAALQSQDRVGTVAFGTLVFNSVVILGILIAPSSLEWVSWFVTAAAGMRLAALGIDSVWSGLFVGAAKGFFRFGRVGLALGRRYLEALAATGLMIALPVISSAMASQFEGGLSGLNYATKLVEFPKGILLSILTMVFFPKISQVYSRNAQAEGTKLVGSVVRILLLLTIPAVICFLGCARFLVEMAFGWGRLSPEQLEGITTLTQLGALSLPAISIVTLGLNVFHARGETRFPFRVSLAMVAFHAAGSSVAVGNWGLPGLALALVATTWLHALVLCAGLSVHYQLRIWRMLSAADLRGIALVSMIAAIGCAISLATASPFVWLASSGAPCLLIGYAVWSQAFRLPERSGDAA